MFEDKIEAMNKQPNAADDNSGFEKRVYTVEEIMDILSIGKNTAYPLPVHAVWAKCSDLLGTALIYRRKA